MYHCKKKSTFRENKECKWLPHHLLGDLEMAGIAVASGAFLQPRNEGGLTAMFIIIDLCLEYGEFWEFGDILVYGKV